MRAEAPRGHNGAPTEDSAATGRTSGGWSSGARATGNGAQGTAGAVRPTEPTKDTKRRARACLWHATGGGARTRSRPPAPESSKSKISRHTHLYLAGTASASAEVAGKEDVDKNGPHTAPRAAIGRRIRPPPLRSGRSGSDEDLALGRGERIGLVVLRVVFDQDQAPAFQSKYQVPRPANLRALDHSPDHCH